MASDNFNEMLEVLANVVKVNRAVTRPYLQKKTGLQIVSKGKDFGEIVTQADLSVSDALLNGGVEGIIGFRKRYPGSFSEEQDSPERLSSLELLQLDPLDGTGDFVDTYHTDNVMPPTTLVSKLKRDNQDQMFVPVSALIFDIVNEVALVSDGTTIGLFKTCPDGFIQDVDFELRTVQQWKRYKQTSIRINRRISYPQLTFDGPFMNFLRRSLNCEIEQAPVGGAGMIGMQVIRGCLKHIKPGVESFASLPSIDICLNTQPDWKTWDIDPLEVFASALGFASRTQIDGSFIETNARCDSLKKMHLTGGFIFTPHYALRDVVSYNVKSFQERNPDCPLLAKDYEYKNAIVQMTRGGKK